MNAFALLKNKNRPTAAITGGALVLSLPAAQSPIVWRVDLAALTAAAFEVTEEKQVYNLILKPSQEKTQSIASFESKKDALEALMAASRALEKSYSAPSAPEISLHHRGKGFFTNLLKWTLTIALVIFAFMAVRTLIAPATSIQSLTPSSAENSRGSAPAVGEPLSAEDFLRSR